MGIIAFIIDLIVEYMEIGKWNATQNILDTTHIGGAWMVFLIISLLFGGAAVLLTAFVGPGAAGGGTAELMGYLNGINYPQFISLRTLFVKIFALTLAVSSGLCIGKEGPLAHIGAIVGNAVVHLPFSWMKHF
jgi:H+/Cl- antiporter ClcA